VSRAAKVVILSAGQGRRLSPLTDDRPKCLIELSGKSLLHWQLDSLRSVGVKEAVVITGFRAERVDEEIARLDLPGMSVRTMFNPFYALTDNLATCWLARGELAGDVMILNGDTLFEPAIAEKLLAALPAEITVSIDRKASYDDDDMRVLTEGDLLKAIGKTITEYNGGDGIIGIHGTNKPSSIGTTQPSITTISPRPAISTGSLTTRTRTA